MKKIAFILFIVLLTGCVDDQGHNVSSGEFKVYFDNKKDDKIATDIANFWKDNGLTTGEAQHVKLVRSENGYQLLLIARAKEDSKNMLFKERKALLDLQEMLKDNIFHEKKIEVIIADDQFKPIVNINE